MSDLQSFPLVDRNNGGPLRDSTPKQQPKQQKKQSFSKVNSNNIIQSQIFGSNEPLKTSQFVQNFITPGNEGSQPSNQQGINDPLKHSQFVNKVQSAFYVKNLQYVVKGPEMTKEIERTVWVENSDKIDMLQRENGRLKKMLSDKDFLIEKLQKNKLQLEQNINMLKDFRDKHQSLDVRVSQLVTEKEKLQELIQFKDKAISSLQEELKQKVTQIQIIQGKLDEHEKGSQQFELTIANLKQQVAALEIYQIKMQENEIRFQAQLDEIGQLRHDLLQTDRLNNELQSQLADQNRLIEVNVSLEGQVEKLKQELNHLKNKYGDLFDSDAKLNDYVITIQSLRNQNDAFSREIGELQKQLENAKQKLAAKSDYDNIKQTLEYLKQKNEEQQAQIDGLQEQIRQLEMQLEMQNQELKEKEEKSKRSQKDRGNREQQDKLKNDHQKLLIKMDQLLAELGREQEKNEALKQQLQHYIDIEKQKQALEDQLAEMLGNIMGGNGERNKLSKRVKDLENQIAQYKDFDILLLKNDQQKADIQRLYNLLSQKDDKIQQLEKQLQLSDTEAQEQLRQQIYKEQERFNKLNEQYTHLLNIENQKKEAEDQLAESLGQIMSGKGERQTLSQKNKELLAQLEQYKDYEILILKFSQQQQAIQRLQQQIKDKNIQIQLLEDKLKQSEEEHQAKLKSEVEKERQKLHQLEEKFGYLLKIENEKKQQEDVLAESLGKILSGDGERTKLVQRNKELSSELDKYKDFEIMILKIAQLQGNLDKFKNSNSQKDKLIKELNDKIISLSNQSQDQLQAELSKQNQKYEDLYVQYQRLVELDLQQKKMEDKVEDALSQVFAKSGKHKGYKQKCKELQDELEKYKDYEILVLKFGQQSKAIEKFKQTVQEKDQKITELGAQVHQLQLDLERANQAKLDLEQNLNKYKVLLSQKEEQYFILNDNNNKLNDELQKYRLEVTKHQQYQDDLQAELKKYNDYQILVLKLQQLQQNIKKLEKLGQNKDELNKDLQEKITKLEQDVHILEQGTKTRDNEIDKLNQLQKHDHEENLQIFKQFQSVTAELEKSRGQVIKLEGQTRDLLMELSKYHDYDIIYQKLNQTQQNYLHIKNEFEEKLDLIRKLQNEINELQAKVDVLERAKQQQAQSIKQIQILVQEKDLLILNLEGQYKQLQEELDQYRRNQIKQQSYIQELQDELARYSDYQQLLFKYEQSQEQINKLRDTIASLEREIQRYKDTILQLEDTLEMQEKEKKQLHSDYLNLKAQYEALLHENTTLKDEIIRQKSEIDNFRLKIQSKDAQISDLNEELAKYADYHQLVIQFKQAEDLIQKLKNTIKERDLLISQLQQQLSDLKYNQEQIISKYEKKVQDLQIEIQKLQGENKTLRDTLEQIKDAYDALQNDLADQKNTFGKQYSEWQFKFKQLEDQLRGDFEFKQNQYINEIEQLKRLIVELQETIDILNSEIGEYKVKLISFSQNDTMIQELQDQLRRLEMQVNFKDQEIGNLRQQLSFSTDYEKKIRILTDEINKETQKSFELEKKLASANLQSGDILKIQTKWQDQMGLSVLLFGEIENLRTKLQEKNQEVKDMRSSKY